MSGHSKWANIKHRKGAQDAARAKVFAKLSKEIMVAAAAGGPDPASNSSLRLMLSKARAKSMPKKNIETAIAKATGGTDGASFKEIIYGGNVSGVSFLIVFLSDNANRVAADVQAAFNRMHGSVAGASSVGYIFDRKGVLELPSEGLDEETVMMQALEAGADDFEADGESFFIYTNPSEFANVKDLIEKEGLTNFETAEVRYEPNQVAKIPKVKAEKILDFIDRLEDNDDVSEVFHNMDPSSLDE